MEFTLQVPVKAPYVVEVIGDLPYFVPIPDKVILKPSLIGAEPFFLEFIQFAPRRHPEESRGENVDDRLGTYVRSKARVIFPLYEAPPENSRLDYEKKAISITNRGLEVIRYVAFDHTVRPIVGFDRTVFRVWRLHEDGHAEPISIWAEGSSFGPFGITPIGRLTDAALQKLWWVFNELSPKNTAWYLILDAKYHSATGDLPRSILDLGTALEINVPRLIDVYSSAHSELSEIDVERVGVFGLYDLVLRDATGHSLHERPDLFIKLEFIRAVRNSIAHNWTPTFQITPQMEKVSRYIEKHRGKDGDIITEKNQVDELIQDSIAIIEHTIDLFRNAFDNKQTFPA